MLRLAESEGIVTPDGLKIPTRYTHHQLAAMIGTSHETITRAFAKLRQAGAVELRSRHIHIEDVSALERAAG